VLSIGTKINDLERRIQGLSKISTWLAYLSIILWALWACVNIKIQHVLVLTPCGPKTSVSLKRVKIEEKLLWSAYRNSPTLFRTVPSPSPTTFCSRTPKIGGLQPHPKL